MSLSRNSEITLVEVPKIIDDIESLRQKTLIAEIKSFRNKIDSDRKNYHMERKYSKKSLEKSIKTEEKSNKV